MTVGSLSPDILLPWGRALLIATFGVALVRSAKGEETLDLPFVRLSVALIALALFQVAAAQLQSLSQELVKLLSSPEGVDLKTFILNSFRATSQEATPSGDHPTINIPAFVEQAWRTGVWGVMTLIVEWVFMLAHLLLESAQAVLWKILLLLFPLACGTYPVFPRMLTNLSLYAVELCLWAPILVLVEAVTSDVARQYSVKAGSLGLYVVAVELVAIFLILSIPAITHRFLSGAFAGDLGSASGALESAKKWAARAKGVLK